METFANLPQPIADAIAVVLSQIDSGVLASKARDLHERYMTREKLIDNTYIQSGSDVLAYLALRSPATYAQIYSAFLQVKERVPSWTPKTMLDLGCGPGTGLWAAKTVWPSIESAMCQDLERSFVEVGEQIAGTAKLAVTATWLKQKITNWIETSPSTKYDLIVVANVFNELPQVIFERLVNQLKLRSSGIVVILEPGTAVGYTIIQNIARSVSATEKIIAPYITSFVESSDYWIHFPQRFNRPEFQRRIRQSMREGSLMASDWEEAKYSYVAFGNVPTENEIWGRSVGPVEKQKGFVTFPVLTRDGISHLRVMKRHKDIYRIAKELKWGETIEKNIFDITSY